MCGCGAVVMMMLMMVDGGLIERRGVDDCCGKQRFYVRRELSWRTTQIINTSLENSDLSSNILSSNISPDFGPVDHDVMSLLVIQFYMLLTHVTPLPTQSSWLIYDHYLLGILLTWFALKTPKPSRRPTPGPTRMPSRRLNCVFASKLCIIAYKNINICNAVFYLCRCLKYDNSWKVSW